MSFDESSNSPNSYHSINTNEEVWVENKSSDNRVYYYNAKTRESSWTKPVTGPNVTILSQEDVERMSNVSKQSKQKAVTNTSNLEIKESKSETNLKADDKTSLTSPSFSPFLPPPGMFPGIASPFPGMPPPFSMPPFGIPPFGMPPFGIPPFNTTSTASLLDDPKFHYSDETKREIRDVEEKLIKCREECLLYTEHSTPGDGKKYYFNTKLNQSFWDKPKCMNELADLESKLELLKKKRAEVKPNEPKKEKELTEEEKAKQKSKPISSIAVPGTPWCVVWTKDKRVFFYNPSEKISLWERPPILVGRVDVDRMISEPPTEALSESTPGIKKKTISELVDKSEPPSKKNRTLEEEDDNSRGSVSSRSESMSPRRDRSASPNSTMDSPSHSQQQIAPDEFLLKNKIEASKEAALEAEHKAAQVRAQLPFEQRVQQFKDLLLEKDVSAYSTWEKELQKIVFDPRYLLLTSKERKQVFDKYVRDRANQESKERAEKLKKKKEDFRSLLKEVRLDHKDPISFSEFSIRYSKDERFKSIEKMKERESLFNDYLNDLRKHDKEDKYNEKDKLKKHFIEMLKELKHLSKHSSWSETKRKLEADPRYRAIESSSKREDYFREYCKNLDEKKSSNINNNNNNNNSEEKLDREKRSESMNEENIDEEEKRKEKQERIEASLRERNKEVQEQLNKYQNEREKERQHLKRDEAVENFKALLIDLIKPGTSSNLSWKEAKKILKRDMRWSHCKILEKDNKEELFEEHMKKFEAKKRDLFYQLLDEMQDIKLKETNWKDIKKLIESDPRYEKLASSKSFKMENEFEHYINDKYNKAIYDFKELLLQTKVITFKSLSTIKENKNHLKEIEDILSNYKSWIVLDCVPEERKKILMEYLEKLDKEGPPPPPTATDPTRRIK